MRTDLFGVAQRQRMMEADEARHSGRTVLKRDCDGFDWGINIAMIISIVFGWLLLYLPLLIVVIVFWIREIARKNIYVKDVATGEKYYITKSDWKQYKKDRKSSNKQTRKLY